MEDAVVEAAPAAAMQTPKGKTSGIPRAPLRSLSEENSSLSRGSSLGDTEAQ
jgi:hypothetical protein